MENSEIARILRDTAELLELDGAMIGRYRSYAKAAELISSLSESVEGLTQDLDKLTELPGIGDRMAEHICEICKSGDYGLRKKLLKKYPVTILEVLSLQSLGPKKAALLWSAFGAGTVDAVEKLAREGKLREMPGFGEKSEQNILKAVEVFKKISGRFLMSYVEEEARKFSEHIRQFDKKSGKVVQSVSPAGSLRRAKETVGDLDLLVMIDPQHSSARDIEALSKHILAHKEIDQVLARGENKLSFRTHTGLQVDVRLLEPRHYGAALIYFTGSKEHNVALRHRALQMGYTLNEYDLATLKGERRVCGATEEEVYAKLKLDWIPPELRENAGEIEAAEEHRVPQLIELTDMRGDLQMHTTASDGRSSIEEMAAAARALGYEYIALTDHSKAVTVANGLDEKRTREQIQKIRHANEAKPGIRILAGSEVDIRKDGRLDLEDDVLAELDVVVASIHSYMNLERAEMTERLLAAIENPYTQIIGHPTGRLLLRRDAYAYDMETILDAAARHGVAMECNAAPDRLDLKDVYLRMCKERGVPVVISTDAHAPAALEFMRFGVLTARRGWIEKKDVLNALPLAELLKRLRPKPAAAAKIQSDFSPLSNGVRMRRRPNRLGRKKALTVLSRSAGMKKKLALVAFGLLASLAIPAGAQKDPAEPATDKPHPKLLPRPAGAVRRKEVDEASMRTLIEQLVACGTRNSLGSWEDPQRGPGCGRDRIVARLNEIAGESGGKLQIVVDKFETTGARTSNMPVHMENVYAILPGSDPALAKTVFIVSGHFDSRASDVMNPNLDAPGADDDASGVAVSMECARLLSRAGPGAQGPYRATILFAAISGEEQGLLGASHMLEWTKQQGYTVGGMLDNDIVGSDSARGATHRVRLFSGRGEEDDADSPSREMARAIEEIDGRSAIRLIFNIDRLGRGGDHYPFYVAGLAGVRFTEPLEDYRHQHQTPRTEGGVEYGDYMKYLTFKFMGNVARDNAEALRQLALAPAPPASLKLSGGVTPDAKLTWSSAEDPNRAGFEILWRETSNPRWRVYDFVASANQEVLKDVSTDNHFFAVRAVGKNGARTIAIPADSGQRLPPA